MLTDSELDKLLETRAYDYPRTKAMRTFLKKEAPHRVVGLSIEPDGVFIYTDTDQWQDDGGAGTFREDSETEAIKWFKSVVQPGVKNKLQRNPKRRKNTVTSHPVKKNPITPAKLDTFVNDMQWNSKAQLQTTLKYVVEHSKDFTVTESKRKVYRDLARILRSELKSYTSNPSRRKIKKKMRNPRRVNFWVVFRYKDSDVEFVTASGNRLVWTITFVDKIRFNSKSQAIETARDMATLKGWQYGVITDDVLPSKIRAKFLGK